MVLLTSKPVLRQAMLFVFPFLYLIIGFIFTAIGAWVYNIAAKWVGGIEYTSITVEAD